MYGDSKCSDPSPSKNGLIVVPCCAMVASSPTNGVPCCAMIASSPTNVVSCISSVKAIDCNLPSSLDENCLFFEVENHVEMIRVRVTVRVTVSAATPIGFIGIRLKKESAAGCRKPDVKKKY